MAAGTRNNSNRNTLSDGIKMADQNDETKNATIQADNKSVAVGSIAVGGSTGDINIHAGDIGYSVEEVSVLITQITSTFQPKQFDGRSPYKGLDVFDEEDAELFFGREKLVDDLVGRVKESRTLFVTGPSGSGKSSLIRAGLIPVLKNEGIKNSDRWLYETMTPGRDPIGEVARVASSLASSTNAEDEIRAKAMTDETIFARWCEIALKDSREKRAAIFIDQFEEAFTQVNKEERLAFLNLLTHAASLEKGRVIILFSMRSDFVSNCATYPQLNALLNQEFLQIGAMQPDELVSAIAQPALRVGLRIDPDLIAQIINEMRGEPGALPLMQFALKDLFDSRQEKGGIIALTLGDYLERGGIHKALERHADKAFAGLSENEQELAHSIFSGLIEIGRGTQDTKRTALFDELVPVNTQAEDVGAIVQKLADARLITTDEIAGKETITISHEKLIDAWPWLKKLVDENRDVIALQNQIKTNAKEWADKRRDASYLYSGARLINAREQLDSRKLVLSGTAHEFVKAGILRQKRGQFILITGIATFIGLLLIAVVVFGRQSGINAELAQRNEQIANTAQAASTRAVQQEATAQANADEAEKQAEEAKKQALIALARQLASQAQSMDASRSSDAGLVVLLAVQSLNMFPSSEAVQVLLNDGIGALRINQAQMTHGGGVTSVAFSPDDKYVVSGSDDGTARVWYSWGGEDARMTHDSRVTSVAFSPDGKYVVSGSDDGTARVWEATTGVEIARMTHGGTVSSVIDNGSVSSVAFSPDGKYVVSSSGDTIYVWEATTGVEVARMTHDSRVTSIAFSPDGKYVASGGCGNFDCSSGSVRVWKASTGQEVAHMTHDSRVTSIAFSPDGKYVVSGSNDGTARVWEATTGVEVARMTHTASSVAFSPDGKYVVSGGWDHTARVWEATTGVEVARMTHESRVTSVAFSPDSKYVVSGSGWDIMDSRGYGSTTRVWDASTGVEAARMAHDAPVSSVAFSPDGKYVVSAGCDKVDFETDNFGACTEGTARVWPWQPDDLIASVCAGSYWRMPNLTRAEWKQYIGDALPYQAVCPNEPIEPDVTPTPRAAELESWMLTAYSLTATQLGWTQTPVFSPVEITPGVTYTPAASP
jgi:WD40 repeat protein